MKFLSCLGLLVYMVVLCVISSLLYGVVLSQLWAWFITPMFHVQEITIAQAIGISLVVGLLTFRQNANSYESKSKDMGLALTEGLVATVIPALVSLFFGWIVQHWI